MHVKTFDQRAYLELRIFLTERHISFFQDL